jgi:hypothetical protein
MLLDRPIIALLQRPNLLTGWGCNGDLPSPETFAGSYSPVAPSIQAHRHERTPLEGAILI